VGGGSLTFLGAGGAAALAAGLAIPPIAPFSAVVTAGSFYFKLRARWAKEDPPRPDYDIATDFRPPQLDLMMLMPAGPIPTASGGFVGPRGQGSPRRSLMRLVIRPRSSIV
jgi:hypothetical protein